MPAIHTSTGLRRACSLAAVMLLLALAGLAATAGIGAAADKAHPYNLGCKALAAGDVAGATTLFKLAVKQDPSDTDALNNLAVCYVKSGDYAKAVPLLQKVLKLNAKYRGANLNIGAGYLFQDEPDKATPPTTKAKDTPPTKNGRTVKAAALYNLGLIAAQDGQYADAQDYFEKSAAVTASPQTDLALATAQAAGGESDKAITSLERLAASEQDADVAKAAEANLAGAYYQRGMARLDEGQVDDAEADFAKSNETASNDYARMGLALVDAERGDRDAAADVLTDLTKSADDPQLAKAASANLASLDKMTGGGGGTSSGSNSWLTWLVWIGGGVLFAVQFYVVMRAATPARRRGTLGMVKVALGAVVGIATAAVFAWAFVDPPSSPLIVLVALAIDVIVVVLAALPSAKQTPRPA